MARKSESKAAPGPGQRLRAARKQLGLNQSELAGAVGVTQSSIAAYETGSRPPPPPVLLALEHVFRISREWILEGTGEPFAGVRPSRPVILTSPAELEKLRRLEQDGPMRIDA